MQRVVAIEVDATSLCIVLIETAKMNNQIVIFEGIVGEFYL